MRLTREAGVPIVGCTEAYDHALALVGSSTLHTARTRSILPPFAREIDGFGGVDSKVDNLMSTSGPSKDELAHVLND